MAIFLKALPLCLGVLALTACGKEPQKAIAPDAGATQVAGTEIAAEIETVSQRDTILASLSHEDRSDEDKARDEQRKPLATLTFAGLKPGMVVLELEAGTGYFTEVIARALGPNGMLYMQNPQAFNGFLGNAIAERLGNGRLPNVTPSRTLFDALEPDSNSVDMVTWMQGPHELWFEIEGEELGDPAGSFAEIFRVLKPGGSFIVIDHNALAGSPVEIGGTLHRVDFEQVKMMALVAGLDLNRTSDILQNDEDPLTISVFDPTIRGNTSQFMAVFVKPE